MVGNLALTLARGAFEQIDGQWRDHKRHCTTCSWEARSRRWHKLCSAGTRLHDDREACKADLDRERELDKLPDPDQAPLW